MRPFSAMEEQNMAYLVKRGISFTLVQTTATGLKKSILDATAPMRTYFLENGIHDYAEQAQGQEHKCLVPTVILDECSRKETQSSLYRPCTKEGDPRMWVYGLAAYSGADDIHAILAYQDSLYVVNITQVDIHAVCTSSLMTPLQEFVNELDQSSRLVSDELLQFFRQNAGRWFESEVNADTGIGRTIETLLGIPQNSNKTPDYKGIELKSHRNKRSSTRNTLFSQSPNWELSALKSGKEIVSHYGYLTDEGKLTYQNTIQCVTPNSQGLFLNMNQLAQLLELQHSGNKVTDVAVWTLRQLHDRLAEKHRETFWIAVDNRNEDGKEYFQFSSIEHTKSPILPQFDILLGKALITVDLLLCRPSGHGDTYSFKIKKKAMPMLFPESTIHRLN